MFHKSMLLIFAVNLISTAILHASPKSEIFHVSHLETKIMWRGHKLFKLSEHNGTIMLHKDKPGTVTFQNNKPVKAEFYVDMKTIEVTDDMDDKYKKNLVEHLKSEDFFHVAGEGNETSRLLLTDFKPMETEEGGWQVSGTLTIKNITSPVIFRARMNLLKDRVMATASFYFDRTAHKVMYASRSILDPKKMADKIIANDIELKVELMAHLNKPPKTQQSPDKS